ncbi:MAG: hypothetical protein SLRJCFUN_000678, partial [Candidatus Fervidibacter sp.]
APPGPPPQGGGFFPLPLMHRKLPFLLSLP